MADNIISQAECRFCLHHFEDAEPKVVVLSVLI